MQNFFFPYSYPVFNINYNYWPEGQQNFDSDGSANFHAEFPPTGGPSEPMVFQALVPLVNIPDNDSWAKAWPSGQANNATYRPPPCPQPGPDSIYDYDRGYFIDPYSSTIRQPGFSSSPGYNTHASGYGQSRAPVLQDFILNDLDVPHLGSSPVSLFGPATQYDTEYTWYEESSVAEPALKEPRRSKSRRSVTARPRATVKEESSEGGKVKKERKHSRDARISKDTGYPQPIHLPQPAPASGLYPCGIEGCASEFNPKRAALTQHLLEAHYPPAEGDKTKHDRVQHSVKCPYPVDERVEACRKPMKLESLSRHILETHLSLHIYRCPVCGSDKKSRRDSVQRHIRVCCVTSHGGPPPKEELEWYREQKKMIEAHHLRLLRGSTVQSDDEPSSTVLDPAL